MKDGLIAKTKIRSSRLTKGTLLGVSIISLIVVVYSLWNYQNFEENTISTTKADLQKITKDATEELDKLFKEAMLKTDSLADALTEGKLNQEQMLDGIKKLVLKDVKYFGSTVAFRPYGFNQNVEKYSPYIFRGTEYIDLDVKTDALNNREDFNLGENDSILDGKDLGDTGDDDYNYFNEEWYSKAMSEGSRWCEPYWDEAGEVAMVTYSSVFYKTNSKTKKKEPLGVVTLDISIDHFKSIIEDIDLGKSGFGALISANGVYLYHPKTKYVIGRKTILEVAKEKNDKDRFIMARKAKKGESGILDHISTTTNKESWLVFATIPTTGWSLQNTFLKDDIASEVDTPRHKLMWIVCSALLFMVSLSMFLYSMFEGAGKIQWLIVTMASIFILSSIGAVWSIALNYDASYNIKGTKITDGSTLRRIKKTHENKLDSLHQDPPIFVPTGLYIDAVKFSGPNDLKVNGYAWQKYPLDYPKHLPKEFTLSKASSISIHKISSIITDSVEVIQFNFEAEIRQNLSAKTYPMEEEVLEIQIVQKGFNRNVMLVPDLESYKVKSASLLPGIGKGAFISGWKLTHAYYELRQQELNTNFGMNRASENNESPVLYYNIGIQRNFVDAFISNLTPLIIVAIMLFFLLMVGDKIDTSKVFSICIGMFFVIVFSHIDIRGKISAQEIFYLEYFFFLTYGLILYVAVNSIRLLMNSDSEVIQYRNRLYLLMFWPAILGVIFLITILTFY